MARHQSSHRQESPEPSPKADPAALRSRPFAPTSQGQGPTPASSEQGNHPVEFSVLEPGGSRSQPIQAKLTIGAPGDRYEQEADRVAAQVVQQINSPQVNQPQAVQREAVPEEEALQMKPVLQRMETPEKEELQMKPSPSGEIVEGDASPDLETAIARARGRGQALAPDLQAKMGQAMGADFSGVRVHTDSQSDQLNHSIQAKAFTTGQDVFFRQGAYQPGSRGGQELIAHELTHVVQQKTASALSNQGSRQALGNTHKAEPAIQRKLDFHHTQWDKATDIEGSKDGGGGVLFIRDADSAIVVKPNIDADTEMIATELFKHMETQDNRKGGKSWKIRGVETRILKVEERKAIAKLETNLRLKHSIDAWNQRTTSLLSAVKGDGVECFVQENLAGKSWSKEIRDKYEDQKGHMGGNVTGKKRKLRDDSPLKPLTEKEGFIEALGRIAAVDIFLGQFDRLIMKTNIDNIMLDHAEKTIRPIDNDVKDFENTSGLSTVTDLDARIAIWVKSPMVALLLSKDYMTIANSVFSLDGNGIAGDTLYKALMDDAARETKIHYSRIPEVRDKNKVATPQSTEDLALMKKLIVKQNKMANEFAIGIANGVGMILNKGPLTRDGRLADVKKARRDEYNERLQTLKSSN